MAKRSPLPVEHPRLPIHAKKGERPNELRLPLTSADTHPMPTGKASEKLRGIADKVLKKP